MDGREVHRIQIWSALGCRVLVAPTPPHAGTLRTQQPGLTQESYTPAPPHLRPSHAPPASGPQWCLLGAKWQITVSYFTVICYEWNEWLIWIMVCICHERISWKSRGMQKYLSHQMVEILTKSAQNGHHSESLQMWSRWPHICHSYNLQHVQSVGKRDTIVTITLLPWPHARRQPSVTDFQPKKATAELSLLS